MINIDFVNINNAVLIGRLLPFWARGRKISLLLQAILSPLISIHNNFKTWALERFIECHITSQRSSLEWFLKHKLQQHFLNEGDAFFIADGIDRTICCFSNNIWTNELYWDNQMHWSADIEPLIDVNANYSCINSGRWHDERLWNQSLPWVNEPDGEEPDDNFLLLINGIVVYAPAIIDTISYNAEDYERDIRFIMSNFMTNFRKIHIIIANTNKKSSI